MDENDGRRRKRSLRDRISALEKERHEALKCDKRFTSNEENVHSFGKFEVFQEGTQQRYNKRIKVLEDELKALGEGTRTNEKTLLLDSRSLRCKRRRLTRKRKRTNENRRNSNSVESYDHSQEENNFQRDVGSQSESDFPASECDSGGGSDNECSSSVKQSTRRKEVIEILDSSDSSDDDDQDQNHTEGTVGAEAIDSDSDDDDDDDEVNKEGSNSDSQLSGEDNNNSQESSENLTQQTRVPLDSGRMESDDDHFDTHSDDDEDEDDVRGELRKENMHRIKESKLFMAVQGFRQKSVEATQPPDIDDIDGIDGSSQTVTSIAIANDAIPFEAEGGEVIHHGERFRKNHCYMMGTGGGNQEIVGILDFVSDHAARCILVVRFEDTIIGIEDEGLEYKADYIHESHVQIYKELSIVELSELGEEPEDVKEIPKLIYEPQRDGKWCQFGYFYNEHSFRQVGRRNRIRSLEFFAGCGGSLQGYHSCNFETVMAIENDDKAVKTLKANNEGLRVYEGCVRDFIRDYDTLSFALGKIDHIHFSPPCKGFSSANRNEIMSDNDRVNNNLSLLIIDVIRKTSCATAVFENVLGMWRRKNVHYMKNIVKELLKLNYQVRCATLKACDYGDAQKRPRFFMFISKKSIPIPSIPAKTHEDTKSHVTVEEAFSCLDYDEGAMENMNFKTSDLRPGQHGLIRLDSQKIAPSVRASSIPPFHYKENRCISVREAATLQSFPTYYIFHGNITSQYRQVGNAIPVKLASNVARSIQTVLAHKYEGE